MPPKSTTSLRKGKERKSVPAAPIPAANSTTPSPSKRGRHRPRATSKQQPEGSKRWELVCTQHNKLNQSNQSTNTVKKHYNMLLKLPVPTGRKKMHPLHQLALAVDCNVSKAIGILTINNSPAQDPFNSNLDMEFERAKSNMQQYGFDFNMLANFKTPLLDEDAFVDLDLDKGPAADQDAKDNAGDSGADNRGNGKEVYQPSEANSMPDNGKPALKAHPLALCKSPPWDLHKLSGPAHKEPTLSGPPSPMPPVRPPVKTPARLLEVFGAQKEPAPAPSPLSQLTQADATSPIKKPLSSKPLNSCNAVPSKSVEGSKKRKVISNDQEVKEERIGKREAKGPASKKHQASGPKGGSLKLKSQNMAVLNNSVIDILSDKSPALLNKFLGKKQVGNVSTMTIQDLSKQNLLLCNQLATARNTIQQQGLQIIRLQSDLQVQARIEAKLARRAQLPYHLPPAFNPVPNREPPNLEHPFNQPILAVTEPVNAMFGTPHLLHVFDSDPGLEATDNTALH
ncbi:hypothetical protein RHS03_07559, partial [Rhizoctonia solani]